MYLVIRCTVHSGSLNDNVYIKHQKGRLLSALRNFYRINKKFFRKAMFHLEVTGKSLLITLES